ncbi:MAG: hypothetical protein HT580_08840 [Dechloromonas sp.]|nr:MAG: hypothetical protein HT580_08840 [Dechloromonas sp.]
MSDWREFHHTLQMRRQTQTMAPELRQVPGCSWAKAGAGSSRSMASVVLVLAKEIEGRVKYSDHIHGFLSDNADLFSDADC